MSDGAGQLGKYEDPAGGRALSWGSATDVARGVCGSMSGTSVGARRSCTVLGLQPSTAYQFQLVAFRGTLNVDAVFGGLSNIASGTTSGSPPPPPPPRRHHRRRRRRPRPPPPPGVLIQEGFEDAALAGRGWYDNTSPVLTTAQHTPGSTHALEMHFPSARRCVAGALRHLFTATPTLYVSYWVKYSSNWVGSGRPYHPHEVYVLSDQDGDWDGPSNNWLTLYVEHNYQNGGIPRLAVQDNKAINTSFGAPPVNLVIVTENRSTGGCNGILELNIASECFNVPPWYNDKQLQAPQVWFQPTSGGGAGYKGNWNHVEVYFQMNSIVGGIGVADGVMQYWFNGTLVIDRHDILFRTGARPTIQFHQFIIAPYIGDGSPVDQYMWVDDLTVATGKPSTP